MPRVPALAGGVGLSAALLLGCGPTPTPVSLAPSATTPSAPASTRPAAPAHRASPRPSPRVDPVPPCTQAGALAGWSLDRLAEQTVVVPVQEDDVAAVSAEVAAGAGGVILFGSDPPASLPSNLAQLTALARGGIRPLVMTDEEGGAVQRMANLVGWLPSARDMAATMSPGQIRQLAYTTGQRLRAAGVTMDLAPVADLDDRAGPNDANPDGTRSFSATASVTTPDALAFVAGLQAAGVVAVVKHFPGLGYATANTDVSPAATRPWSALKSDGLLPFAAAVRSGVDAVMVANATVPGLTGLPASLSPDVVTGVLRGQLGFAGLVLTDSLSAVSVVDAGYPLPRASVAALAAGADLVLFNQGPPGTLAQTDGIVTAVVAAVRSGALSRARLENAVLHVLAAKHADLCG